MSTVTGFKLISVPDYFYVFFKPAFSKCDAASSLDSSVHIKRNTQTCPNNTRSLKSPEKWNSSLRRQSQRANENICSIWVSIGVFVVSFIPWLKLQIRIPTSVFYNISQHSKSCMSLPLVTSSHCSPVRLRLWWRLSALSWLSGDQTAVSRGTGLSHNGSDLFWMSCSQRELHLCRSLH